MLSVMSKCRTESSLRSVSSRSASFEFQQKDAENQLSRPFNEIVTTTAHGFRPDAASQGRSLAGTPSTGNSPCNVWWCVHGTIPNAFPELPFTWLVTGSSEDKVFLLRRDDLPV